jgi:hypothetical protein
MGQRPCRSGIWRPVDGADRCAGAACLKGSRIRISWQNDSTTMAGLKSTWGELALAGSSPQGAIRVAPPRGTPHLDKSLHVRDHGQPRRRDLSRQAKKIVAQS